MGCAASENQKLLLKNKDALVNLATLKKTEYFMVRYVTELKKECEKKYNSQGTIKSLNKLEEFNELIDRIDVETNKQRIELKRTTMSLPELANLDDEKQKLLFKEVNDRYDNEIMQKSTKMEHNVVERFAAFTKIMPTA